ncbi:MAG: regulatory protein RecX [Phycisphaeraceae bacterium]
MAESPRQITAIRPVSTSPDRATVRVGRKSVATLSTKLITDLDLHVGQPWTPELEAQVAEAAAYDKALRRAMHRLARRAMSRRDLDRKLRDLDYEPAVRERVLDRLEELGYLDDAEYGRMVIRDQLARKPAGPFFLKQKLMQKGLDRELIDRLVDEATAELDQAGQAREVAERRLRTLARFDPPTRRRRLYGLLARRGFDSEAISAALEELREQIER